MVAKKRGANLGAGKSGCGVVRSPCPGRSCDHETSTEWDCFPPKWGKKSKSLFLLSFLGPQALRRDAAQFFSISP